MAPSIIKLGTETPFLYLAGFSKILKGTHNNTTGIPEKEFLLFTLNMSTA